MGLKRYVLKRTLMMIPVIFTVIVLNFLLIYSAPGDPVITMGGEEIPQKAVEFLRHKYGLDKPIHEQLIIYLKNILRGDLGYSYNHDMPVLRIILNRFPATLILVLSAQFLSMIIGTLLGAYSAKKYPSKTDAAINLSWLALYSLPVFWTALMLILMFSWYIPIFPSTGMLGLDIKVGVAYYMDVAWHAFLPIVTLSLHYIPSYLRLARSNVIEVMNEDFITTCRAIGLDENAVFIRHALKNALLPIITMAGLRFGLALTGAMMTETVFGWPGIGQLMFWSATTRDYPVIMGGFLFSAICVVVATLATDILYGVIDPRIRI